MGKKKKTSKPAIGETRLTELVTAIENKASMQDVSDDEFRALALHLATNRAVDELTHMASSASGKTQRKAIKEALFRLKRQGLDGSALKEILTPITMRSSVTSRDDLPVLMSPPQLNAGRMFFFPYQSGKDLWLIEARFEEPVGLAKLQATKTTRGVYRDLVNRFGRHWQPDKGPPTFIPADRTLVQRKFWEIHRMIRRSRVGADVDPAAVETLSAPNVKPAPQIETAVLEETGLPHPAEPVDLDETAPPHPVYGIELEEITPLTIAQLEERKTALTPFMHQTLYDRLKTRLDAIAADHESLSAIEKEALMAEAEAEEVGAWVESWGIIDIVEVILDTAYVQAQLGDREAARTLRDVVTTPADDDARQAAVLHFLNGVVNQFRTGGHTPTDPE